MDQLNGNNENKNTLFKCFLCLFGMISIINFVLICVQISKKQYNDGYFQDLSENLNLSPIKKIELVLANNSGYINLFTKENPIYNWKDKYFKIERSESNYLDLINNETNNLFQIGTDASGKKLYSNEKAINFIEITNTIESSLHNLNYSIITQQIDSNTYLHYSNEYINGKVLVDIKLGLEKKPCDDSFKNDNLDISKYSCKDEDSDLGNTYQKLDALNDSSSINIENVNGKIYMYGRTYISVPEDYKIYHNLNGIKKFANKKSVTNLILYFASIFVNCFCACNMNFGNIRSLGQLFCLVLVFLINTLILMICPIIKISLLSIAIKNYNNYNKFIFSKLEHGIKNIYKKNIWFIRYDLTILVFEIFLFIPSLTRLFVLFCLFLGLLGICGKKAINSMAEKLKKREERKKRIKKYKEEIEELEKNPDIPISKLNEKKLQFFKEQFYYALTCPISLEIFQNPVIVSSGHTYEKEYIIKVINEEGKDPFTRELLNKKIIIENYLVKRLITEFNSGIDFNENIFNKMIDLLKCPLSHKFFQNPYLASVGTKGMTYERSYIEEYLFNNKKDPIFNENIKGDLIKNYVIKNMVDALIEMNEKRKDYSIEIHNSQNNENIMTKDKFENIDKNPIKKNNILFDEKVINKNLID